jgi:hypothetical protein
VLFFSRLFVYFFHRKGSILSIKVIQLRPQNIECKFRKKMFEKLLVLSFITAISALPLDSSE